MNKVKKIDLSDVNILQRKVLFEKVDIKMQLLDLFFTNNDIINNITFRLDYNYFFDV